MYKPNNKKMLTVLISVTMVLSALTIIAFAATPAYATSPTFTTDPTVFAVTSSTVVEFSETSGAFTAGSTVTFYVNTADTFPTGATSVGTITLGAGVTSLSGLSTTFDTNGLTAGTYYLAATSGSGSGYIAGNSITVSTLSPEIALSGSNQAGGTAVVSSVSGHPFDASSSVTVYLNYAGGTTLVSQFSVGADGLIPADTTFTVPTDIPQAAYYVVAQETSSSSTNYGITAEATFSLTPMIAVVDASNNTVNDISGATSSSFYIDGFGFAASSVISSYTSSASSVTVGGVDALHSSLTVSANGNFYVGGTVGALEVTSLASAITTTGPQTIVITTTPATTSNSFPAAVYVSSPTGTPQLTVTDTTTSTNNGNVGDTIDIVILNMLASSSVTVTMAGSTIATGTTDSNGFLSTTGAVPAVAGGTYTVFAETSSSSTVTEAVTASFQVLPLISYSPSSSVTAITGEYAPVSAKIYVIGTGLTPNTEYAVTDTGFTSLIGGTGNIYADYASGAYSGTITTSIGTPATNNMGVMSTATGEFSLHYTADYSSLATGSNETITVTGGSLSAQSTYYYAIGSATVTIGSFSYDYTSNTQSVSVTVGGLIPYGSAIAAVTTGTQPTDVYKLYSGSSGTTLENVYVNGAASSVSSFYTTTGSVSLTFGANNLGNGYNTVNVVYYGFTPSTATAIVGDSNVVGSSPGTSAGGVHPVTSSGSPGQTLNYALYDFPASTTVTYSYYTISGKQSATITTDANGAANLSFAVPMTPAGSYSLTFSVEVSGTTTSTQKSLTVTAVISDVPSSSASYPESSAASKLFPNQNVTLYAYGLSPEAYYAIYADTSTTAASSDTALAYFTTDSTGSYNTGVTVTLPSTLVSGTTYYLDVLPASTVLPAAATVSYSFTAGSFNNIFGPTFNYTSNTESAFPGQLVNFAWVLPSGHNPLTPAGGSTAGPVYVTVLLNGTAYTTLPANVSKSTGGVYTLSGSFAMPNNDTGAYWTITLEWTQVDYSSTVAVNSYMMPSSSAPTLKLVSGAGALIVGISTSGLATIVSNAVTSAFKVPLAELNASITSIKGLTANITTAFGKMTTTLSAINATVASIESGQVLVQTDLGSIKTSLASLNASLVVFNGNVATINTTLGRIQTSLSSIGTQVTTNGNGIATITTDLGTLSGTVTSTSGNVASISTSLGNLNATVAKINSNTSGFSTLEIFLVVIVVLVLITLVLSFLAISSVNRVSKKIEEQKKQ